MDHTHEVKEVRKGGAKRRRSNDHGKEEEEKEEEEDQVMFAMPRSHDQIDTWIPCAQGTVDQRILEVFDRLGGLEMTSQVKAMWERSVGYRYW